MKDGMKRLILLGLMLVLAAGCSLTSSFTEELYEDERWIAREGDSFSYQSKRGEADSNRFAYQIQRFSGKERFLCLEVETESVVSMEIEIEKNLSGLFKLVLISPQKQVTTIKEGAGWSTMDILLDQGSWYLMLVGYKSSVELAGTVSYDPAHICARVIEF